MLQPFIHYYGGKGNLAKYYPRPTFRTIVEPFAGGASYSLRYPHHNVILVEKNKILYRLWKWLIEVATREDIIALPPEVSDIQEVDACREAKYLIGWWLNTATVAPCRTPSKWMRQKQKYKANANFWCAHTRNRLAKQVEAIKHWRVFFGDFSIATSVAPKDSTWFIDPPYQGSGTYYIESSRNIDFDALGDWCQSLPGQVIVCEQEGSDWLPFVPLHNFSRGGMQGPKVGREVVWLSDGKYRKRSAGFGII